MPLEVLNDLLLVCKPNETNKDRLILGPWWSMWTDGPRSLSLSHQQLGTYLCLSFYWTSKSFSLPLPGVSDCFHQCSLWPILIQAVGHWQSSESINNTMVLPSEYPHNQILHSRHPPITDISHSSLMTDMDKF